jgi:antitoxin FitA
VSCIFNIANDDFSARPNRWIGNEIDMAAACDHHDHMPKMIQIRHVPDHLHGRLKARAALAGMSLSDYLLNEIRHIAEVPSPEEMRKRLESREPVNLTESIEDAVRAERDSR